jgi:hypothetical protein
MVIKDTANIGLSGNMHFKLREMADNGIFNDLKDGYRLAASLAIKLGLNADDRILDERKNMYDVGGVDEDFIFRNSIRVIFPNQKGQEYKYLEKLADAGMEILYQNYDENGSLDITSIIENDS